MSEPRRMTEEDFTFLSQQGYFDRSDMRRLFAETKRARASEAEKDKVIKKLADALLRTQKGTHDGVPCWCSAYLGAHSEYCEQMRAALRSAGALP